MPVGIQRTDITPVGRFSRFLVTERISEYLVLANGIRDDIFSKIVLGYFIVRIMNQLVIQKVGTEHIVAHRGQTHAGLTGYLARYCRFFLECNHASTAIYLQHAIGPSRFFKRNFDTGYRQVCVLIRMESKHGTVVHFIDMVS